jgi:hypothetical protein
MSVPSSTVEIQFPLYATGRPPGERSPSETPPSGNGRLPRVTQVMALAIHFQDMIQRGEARDYADLARLGCLTRERMSQIMELVWLAPEIQREILEFPPTGAARFPISEVAVRRIGSDFSWEEQQHQWRELKQIHHLL